MGGTIDQSTGKFRSFTVEELKSQGYSAAAAASLHDLSQSALESAVNIRTIPQLFQALKEFCLDLTRTPFIGDDDRDEAAAIAAGCLFERVDDKTSLLDVAKRMLGLRAHQKAIA